MWKSHTLKFGATQTRLEEIRARKSPVHSLLLWKYPLCLIYKCNKLLVSPSFTHSDLFSHIWRYVNNKTYSCRRCLVRKINYQALFQVFINRPVVGTCIMKFSGLCAHVWQSLVLVTLYLRLLDYLLQQQFYQQVDADNTRSQVLAWCWMCLLWAALESSHWTASLPRK